MAVLLFRWPAGRPRRPACCLIIERVASVLGASMAFDSVSAPARYISSNGQYGGYGQTDGCVVVRWAWDTYAERMGEFWEGRNFTCAPLETVDFRPKLNLHSRVCYPASPMVDGSLLV